MLLYLMRHGIAERQTYGGDDQRRTLTEHGRQVLDAAAGWLGEILVAPNILLHSPYQRARQTAQIIANAWGLPSTEDARLAPGCGLDNLAEIVDDHDGAERLMTVGHQPDVGILVQLLTGRTISIREGTLVVIETPSLRPRTGIVQRVYDTLTLAAST